jgi:hypothetical protein
VWLLALTVSSASAQGISLRWSDCVLDGGTRNAAFACNTNSGSRALVTSFLLTAGMPAPAITATIDITAADLALPAWWEFRGCRSGGVVYSPSSTGPVLCSTWANFCTTNSGIVSYTVDVTGPNTARLVFRGGVCSGPFNPPPLPLVAGVEYVGPVVSMNFNRTVGSPSCDGCGTPVCLVLTHLVLGTVDMTTPFAGADGNMVTWQGAGLTPGGVCQAATATRRTVWGAVKALYR